MKPATHNGLPKTPAYRLRANRTHSKLKTLCYRWIKRNRPEVLATLHTKAKKEAVANG